MRSQRSCRQDTPVSVERPGGVGGGDHHRPGGQAGRAAGPLGGRSEAAPTGTDARPDHNREGLRRPASEKTAGRVPPGGPRASAAPAVRLLLDSHVFLWWLRDDRRLSRRARAAIAAPGASVVVSAASIWEIAIKLYLGKLQWRDRPRAAPERSITARGFRGGAVPPRPPPAVSELPPPPPRPFEP